MRMTLVVNSILEWVNSSKEKIERVLWIDSKGSELVVISLSNPKALPEWKNLIDIYQAINNGEVIKRIVDPYPILSVPEEEILEKHKDRRDHVWELIKDLVTNEPNIFQRDGRGSHVHQIAKESGIHQQTIYKYLRKYWQGGKIKNALLPTYHNCGAPGRERKATEGIKRGRPPKTLKTGLQDAGINVDEDVKRIFRIGAQLYYNTKEKAPLRRAYELMIANHFNKGYSIEGNTQIPVLPPASELPTFGQFRYWFTKEQDLKNSLTSRIGERNFALRKRAVLGNSTQMAFGPGSIYQIDATIADVYLVSRYDRSLIIGRPVIYMIVDVFSRLITGMYVGLEGPNYLGAMMALANATADKVLFCAEHQVEITKDQWPCNYLPESLLADRGELLGKNADNIVNSLNIAIANTPPYRADWKGIVEQSFRLANLKTIHWLPGAVKTRLRERGELDYRLDAKLDLQQFTKIMIYTVLDHNLNHWIDWYSRDEFMISEQVKPIPIELWKWGINNRSGHLREKEQKHIMLNLLPQDTATVTYKGIRFKGMYYSSESALKEQWFERARSYGNWTLPVSYDHRKTDIIYLRLRDGREIEACHLLERECRYKGYRLEEALDLLELESVQKANHVSNGIQASADLNARINSIAKEAEEKTNFELSKKNISKTQRIKNIRSNRANEKTEIRQNEAWQFEESTTPNERSSTRGKIVEMSKSSDTEQNNDNRDVIVSRKSKLLKMLQEE
ncbi:Mu transposase C-terminal domain-containing protein [Desulforamulus ruminis]|uniref:Mu transposase C-terminal domain-containing protein n=1 Tax=Desulforamulus ruminis TaxID=1564 RepID=UPI002FDAADEC